MKNRLADLRKAAGYSNRAKFLKALEENGIEDIRSGRMYDEYEKGTRDIPLEFAYKIARFHGVSVEYLCGYSDYENIGNEQIEEITGLSNDAIEVLKEMKAAGGGAFRNIEIINHILENEYDKVREIRRNRQDQQTRPGAVFTDTILTMIYESVFFSGAVYQPITENKEHVEVAGDYAGIVNFMSNGGEKSVGALELWKAYNIRRVTQWIEKEIEKREGGSSSEYAKFYHDVKDGSGVSYTVVENIRIKPTEQTKKER